MNITVYPLSPDDRSPWEKLYHKYAEFYEMPMNKDILDTVWSWIFDESNAFYGLIAKSDEGIAVGLMHYREMPSPIRGSAVGFLDDLFVIPECRGKGAVEALYSSLNSAAIDKGWPFVRWITAEDNYRGRAVYDKLADKTQWVTYQMPVQ